MEPKWKLSSSREEEEDIVIDHGNEIITTTIAAANNITDTTYKDLSEATIEEIQPCLSQDNSTTLCCEDDDDDVFKNLKNNNNLHVKFNSKKKQQQKEEQSPSISSDDASSEDNSSLGQFAEAHPPDGGWGWVVVAAAFMVNLIADGITFSFGVIYVEFLNYFGQGKSKTAWIGSLFMAMPLLSGPVASFLTDRYGCRRVSIAGSILATLGFVISSFTDSLLVLIFTFGVIAGFGLSLCFVAAVVIVAYYFDKRRSFATGLSVCGSGIGTTIFAPLIEYLLTQYGWRGTTLILAGCFLNLAVCGCLMRDLEWTTVRAKAKSRERKQRRKKQQQQQQQQRSSEDSMSVASLSAIGTFASANPMVIENYMRRTNQDEETAKKVFSSLLTLPTYLKNGEQVPIEVIELLATRSDIYNVLLHNYPSTIAASSSSKTCSESGLDYTAPPPPPSLQMVLPKETTTPTIINMIDHHEKKTIDNDDDDDNTVAYLWWLKKLDRSGAIEEVDPRLKNHLQSLNRAAPRHSLTYRGAMLNINRYRLRASSCPNIHRNSMTSSIAKTKLKWYSGLWEFRDVLSGMLDFSHFADSRFTLFAFSNFLLHTWYDVPYVYLTDNAIEMGFNEADSSKLISVIGLTNMFGEILLGWAGDRPWINASIVYAICMIFCGAVTSMIPLVGSNYYGLCSVAGAFGLFIAANYSLTSIILVEVITIERFTNAYGLLLLVQGIANLMGPPLAGWLYDITGTYNLSFYVAGFFIGISGLLLMVVPLMDLYKKLTRKNSIKKYPVDINSL